MLSGLLCISIINPETDCERIGPRHCLNSRNLNSLGSYSQSIYKSDVS